MEDLERWKAVEFRNFLLYSGPLVLQGLLENSKMEHFLCFHVATRILMNPESTTSQINHAGKLLNYFVGKFGEIYGAHHLVYNVHSLIHLAQECIFQRGTLDTFSAFPFENYLGVLTRLLRGSRKPLAQLKKRLSEIDKIADNDADVEKQWDSYKFRIKSVNPKSIRDRFCMVNNRTVIKVTEVNETHVIGVPFNLKNDFGDNYSNLYRSPLESSKLSIFVSNGELNRSLVYPKESVHNWVKCVAFSVFDETENLVFFPLLHNL